MKKSLMLISFAFIFLLSVSIVSADFFDWITGDVQRGGTIASKGELATLVSNSEDNTNPFSRTSSSSTSSARTSQASRGSECPRGWETLLAQGGGNCCRKAENTGRTTSRLFSRR